MHCGNGRLHLHFFVMSRNFWHIRETQKIKLQYEILLELASRACHTSQVRQCIMCKMCTLADQCTEVLNYNSDEDSANTIALLEFPIWQLYCFNDASNVHTCSGVHVVLTLMLQ